MKTISKTSSSLLLCLLSAVLPALVMAQSKPVSTMPPPPSNLEKLEESPEPAISIKKPESSKNKMTEKRVNGKVTEVEVQSGKSHYVVKANPEVGNAPKGTVQGDSNRAAQWTLLEFGGKKESKEVEPVPALPPATEPAKAAPASASMPTKK
ncbi:MAG: DUF2782 domain-containing protein [Undibacterium sp.]|uniref:DUF2782 domain-containing protein n=1 Tax=Undibacterium sp. TaxID=1914977 RepID=UPI0027241F71|nr:DUF2782 domain-containing protein [Undibacterium sp.]MDO8651955.1 DUF2782 domain-containing protein [Undibacterium sp.]